MEKNRGLVSALFFAPLPNFDELVAYLAIFQGRDPVVSIQPTCCRELIFTESDVLISPSIEDRKQIYIILQKSKANSDAFKNKIEKLKLEVWRRLDVTREIFQYCLNFTVFQRLAPLWNKVGGLLVQGRNFLMECTKLNAVSLQLTITDKICFSLEAMLIKMPPCQIEDFMVSFNSLWSFKAKTDYAINDMSIEYNSCHVLPSMKQGRLCSISHTIPSNSPFQTYEEIKQHWKLMYGYRLPAEDCKVYYNVRFIGNKIFTYPEHCIRHQEHISYVRCNQEEIYKLFLHDVISRIPTICGMPIRFTSKALFQDISITEALSGDRSFLARTPQLETAKYTQPFKTISSLKNIPKKKNPLPAIDNTASMDDNNKKDRIVPVFTPKTLYRCKENDKNKASTETSRRDILQLSPTQDIIPLTQEFQTSNNRDMINASGAVKPSFKSILRPSFSLTNQPQNIYSSGMNITQEDTHLDLAETGGSQNTQTNQRTPGTVLKPSFKRKIISFKSEMRTSQDSHAVTIKPTFKKTPSSANSNAMIGKKSCPTFSMTSSLVSKPSIVIPTFKTTQSVVSRTSFKSKKNLMKSKVSAENKSLKKSSLVCSEPENKHIKMNPSSSFIPSNMINGEETPIRSNLLQSHTHSMKDNAESVRSPRKSLALELAMQIVSSSSIKNADLLQCLDLSQEFDSKSIEQFLKVQKQRENAVPNLYSNAVSRQMAILDGPALVQKRKNIDSGDDQNVPKKSRAKPKVQEGIDVAELAFKGELGKVNSVTLKTWLKSKGLHVKAADKKGELVQKVTEYLTAQQHES